MEVFAGVLWRLIIIVESGAQLTKALLNNVDMLSHFTLEVNSAGSTYMLTKGIRKRSVKKKQCGEDISLSIKSARKLTLITTKHLYLTVEFGFFIRETRNSSSCLHA